MANHHDYELFQPTPKRWTEGSKMLRKTNEARRVCQTFNKTHEDKKTCFCGKKRIFEAQQNPCANLKTWNKFNLLYSLWSLASILENLKKLTNCWPCLDLAHWFKSKSTTPNNNTKMTQEALSSLGNSQKDEKDQSCRCCLFEKNGVCFKQQQLISLKKAHKMCLSLLLWIQSELGFITAIMWFSTLKTCFWLPKEFQKP